MDSEFKTSPPEGFRAFKLTREMLFLAEQAAEGRLKVLPGKEWALHYPVDSQVRVEKLQGLLDGRYSAQEVARDIKPDALFYDVNDIKKEGLENVSAKVRDFSAFIAHYDYPRFARFVESMRGRKIPIDELDRLYTEVTQARIQKKVMDAYGYTGRKQIENALRSEADDVVQGIQNFPRSQKVLKALKTHWMSEELGIVAPEERDGVVSKLSGDERKVFESLQDSYREYIQRGDENAYKELTKAIREDFPKIQKQVESGQPSESMQELKKELERFKDQISKESYVGDLFVSPDIRDELYTTAAKSENAAEGVERRIFFEITPPLAGFYRSEVKSRFDIDKKTWDEQKKLSPYSASPEGGDRHTIRGRAADGLKAIPLPSHYALDAHSLSYKGTRPEILRDEHGCFYIKTEGTCEYQIDFIKEKQTARRGPIAEDHALMHRGSLSTKTERLIARLSGSSTNKSEQTRQYLFANHFYPGGGNLEVAKALQLKLISESTGNDYIQRLDQSEYLECRSANTLGPAITRKSMVPTLFVVGDRVEGAEGGKTIIDSSTGHSWTEIWDGKEWRRFDHTPNPKPEDQKESDKDKKDSGKESAEEAQDGGIDKPSSSAKTSSDRQGKGGQEGPQGEKKQGQKTGGQKGQQSTESGNLLDQMSDASDSDMQQSESQLQEVKEQMDRMMEQKKQLDEKVQNAEKFNELSDLQKEIKQSELFDDFKKELEKKLEAKEEQMKDKIKDELDKMVEDGFMDEKKRDEILQELEQKRLEELDRVQKEVEQENRLYNEYEDIREEVMPLVDEWFKYFAERLPRQQEVGFDEDSLTRQGAFDRRAVMKTRNLLFGTVKNPREIRPSIKPRFMSSILVDVSGSMAGGKLQSARKLLIFYSELFSRISQAFGYISFSINIFSDSIIEIKGFRQDYDSSQRYDFDDGTHSTVKVRLMQKLATQGGTNMLDGIKKAASELNEQAAEYPDYASAFYFVGDGGDTCGNAANITKFLQMNESEHGFGEHMYSAVLLGDESQRIKLVEIFGDEHTNVAPDFDELIEKSMDKFDEDLTEYLKNKT